MTITNTTSTDSLIRTEAIGETIMRWREAPSILASIAWLVSEPPAPLYRFARLNPLAVPAGTKSEFATNEVFTSVQASAGGEDVTPGVVGVALTVTREASQDASGIPETALASALDAMNARIEADALSVVTSANASMGSSNDTFDVTLLREATRRYMLMRPRETPALVLHPDAWSQLVTSAGTSAASAWTNGERFPQFRATPGFMGAFDGTLPVFVSDQVADSSGAWANFMTSISPSPSGTNEGLSGLGVVVWRQIYVEMDPMPMEYADRWVIAARYGVGLTRNASGGGADNNNLLLIESQPA